MAKIVFMGAGSTVFAKKLIGDCMLTPALRDSHFVLYDIDGARLKDSQKAMETLNRNINKNRAKISAFLGPKNRQKALKGADHVINAIQVGGYEPSTVIDFEIPKKYGLRQTIGDTLGIGGIFRALRTIPVFMDFAEDMEKVCPNAWFLNYTNPMAMLTGAMQRYTPIKTVGLCHSVQGVAIGLLLTLGIREKYGKINKRVAGINHMAWLLEIREGKRDIYPEVKAEAAKQLKRWRRNKVKKSHNMVRLEMMLKFGYYVTESSEHNAEYTPYWIKSNYPELITEYNIPLDEYPRRCVNQIKRWNEQSKSLVKNAELTHEERTPEYGSYIIEAVETDVPVEVGGNVINNGLISNLPSNACVEVPCLVNRNGVQGCFVGDLPEQCAALNRTNINVQLLTIQAAMTRKKEAIYHAAMLDPHTAAELSLDDIVAMCDEMIECHGNMLPKYS